MVVYPMKLAYFNVLGVMHMYVRRIAGSMCVCCCNNKFYGSRGLDSRDCAGTSAEGIPYRCHELERGQRFGPSLGC